MSWLLAHCPACCSWNCSAVAILTHRVLQNQHAEPSGPRITLWIAPIRRARRSGRMPSRKWRRLMKKHKREKRELEERELANAAAAEGGNGGTDTGLDSPGKLKRR